MPADAATQKAGTELLVAFTGIIGVVIGILTTAWTTRRQWLLQRGDRFDARRLDVYVRFHHSVISVLLQALRGEPLSREEIAEAGLAHAELRLIASPDVELAARDMTGLLRAIKRAGGGDAIPDRDRYWEETRSASQRFLTAVREELGTGEEHPVPDKDELL